VGGPEADYYRGVARLGVQAAEALAYAHRQGVLHRDVKPSNLLLDAQGTVWVTDFGLAKAEGADELTQAGDIVGTIRFMAPERFEGKSLPQGDVYSLGVTLYELLTLRPAFDHTNKAKLIDRVVHEPPVPPRKLDARIPRDLETVVLKCLAKDPAERYASAEALAEDIQRFLADRPVKARRATAREHLWRWCRRNPGVASLLGVVALLLVALTVGTLVANAHLRSSLEDANQANREKNARLWQSKRAEARAVRMSARVGQRLEALQSIREALELPLPPGHTVAELRTEAIAALALPDLEVEKQWDGSPFGTLLVAFDARAEHYARITRDATVSLRRVADDAEVARWKEEGFAPFSGAGNEYALMLSPDGRYVAVYHDGLHRLRVRRVEGDQAVLCHEAGNAVGSGRAFSPDGARLVYLLRDRRIAVLELAAGQVRFLHKPLADPWPWWPRISPDGRQFAVCTRVKGQYGVEVRDLATGNLTARLPHPGDVNSPAWHPDGQMLATFGEDLLIRLWDVPSGKLVRVLEGHRNGGGVLAFDRQSGLLLSNDWSAILRVWEPSSGRQLLSRTGGLYTFLNNHLDGRVPSYHPADTGKLQVLRLHPARAYRSLSRLAAGASGGFHHDDSSTVFSGDGRLLFAPTHGNHRISIVDAASGRELNVVPFVYETPFHWGPGEELLTSGLSGVLRWPFTADPDRPGHCRLGPPELLVRSEVYARCGASRDGRIIAIPNFARGSLVWERNRPTRLIPLQPQPDVRGCAVSPDGRWVAAFSHSSDDGFGTKVWDSRTGRLVKALPLSPGSGGFSPDGRWLLTTGGGCRLWRAGTWEEGPTLGGPAGCFAPDGRSLAIEGDGGAIRLVKADSGVEFAHLEGPVHTRMVPLCFSPDGTRLVAAAVETETLVIWDLRALRQELQRLDLDWDAPPYPGAKRDKPGRFEVQLVGATLTDPKKMAEYQRQKAVADLFFNPFDAEAHFRLGRQLLEDGNAERAHAHLGVALAFRPGLDVALYPRAEAGFRLGRWKEAHAAFTRYLRKYPEDGEAYHLRGHVNERLGRYRDAVADFGAALQGQPNDAHLLACRGENYRLIGRHAKAAADCQKSLDLQNNQAGPNRNLAWIHANGPSEFRDLGKALSFAQRAVAIEANVSANHHCLGLVYYRMGRWNEAVRAFEKGLEVRKGQTTAYYEFFLAMCHAQLGDAGKAKDCFDRAVKWVASQKNLSAQHQAELKAFRAEAEELLPKEFAPK
jgi:eukaryotic-like serine/threonine-protein kinase